MGDLQESTTTREAVILDPKGDYPGSSGVLRDVYDAPASLTSRAYPNEHG